MFDILTCYLSTLLFAIGIKASLDRDENTIIKWSTHPYYKLTESLQRHDREWELIPLLAVPETERCEAKSPRRSARAPVSEPRGDALADRVPRSSRVHHTARSSANAFSSSICAQEKRTN